MPDDYTRDDPLDSGESLLLAPLLADPRASAIILDFDGTIAKIVDDPADAVALPGAEATLRALSELFGTVGVVSGRPVDFLADRLAGAGSSLRLVGLYGIETIEAGRRRVVPEAQQWLAAVASVVDRARREAPAGVRVEDKGLSVALHWRKHPEAAPWARAAAEAAAESTGLVIVEARMAVELRPPVRADKGTVVEQLAIGCMAACFAGDDSGDLAAFEALDRLALRGLQTLRIAVASAETPRALLEVADHSVASPEDLLALLNILAALAGGPVPHS